jgi:RNA polymerase sigma factor (sigma-70 family)
MDLKWIYFFNGRDEGHRMDDKHFDYKSLIEPIEDKMIQSVWRIVRDPYDFDDAFQKALSTVWKRLSRIRRHPNPQALILRVCVNAAYDVLRRQARLRRREELRAVPEDFPDPTLSADVQVSNRQEQAEIMDAISRLPRKQAQATLMRFIDGLSYRDIAHALECGEATARTHVMRARKRLSKLLAHLAPEPRKEALK